MGTKALVTGGAGFIGSNLVRALKERGYEVRVLDNFSTGHRANVYRLDIELVEGDLRSYQRVAAATRDVDVVFHEAAIPSVPQSIRDPISTSEVNVGGTLNVLLASRPRGQAGSRRNVELGVRATPAGMPRRESQLPQPMSPYAVSSSPPSSTASPLPAHTSGDDRDVLLHVFGEHQDPLSGYAAAIPKFILMLNALLTVLGEPLALNVVSAHGPPRPGDVGESMADRAHARQLLGHHPDVDFVTRLKRTIEWISAGWSCEARSAGP